MDDLLTTKQVQDILKVDRITVYRMLQDGRLKAVKIGQQWRFPAGEVNRFLEGKGARDASAALTGTAVPGGSDHPGLPHGALPIHCVQVIQGLYAGLGKIGAVTVDTAGLPLTEASPSCSFCALMLASPSGRAACTSSWRACTAGNSRVWFACHAGLQYQQAAICENNLPVAYLLSGQVYLSPQNHKEEAERVRQLAVRHQIDPDALLQAAADIPIYRGEKREEIENWPARFTLAIESILKERAGLMNKLQKIAEISTI